MLLIYGLGYLDPAGALLDNLESNSKGPRIPLKLSEDAIATLNLIAKEQGKSLNALIHHLLEVAKEELKEGHH